MERITIIQLAKGSTQRQRYRVVQAVNVLNPKIGESLKEDEVADLIQRHIQVIIKPPK